MHERPRILGRYPPKPQRAGLRNHRQQSWRGGGRADRELLTNGKRQRSLGEEERGSAEAMSGGGRALRVRGGEGRAEQGRVRAVRAGRGAVLGLSAGAGRAHTLSGEAEGCVGDVAC